jgi:hypothetical protein
VIESRGRLVNVSQLFGRFCKVKIPARLSRGYKSNMHVKLVKKADAGLFELLSNANA